MRTINVSNIKREDGCPALCRCKVCGRIIWADEYSENTDVFETCDDCWLNDEEE